MSRAALRVAIVAGGPSPEAHVSRASAEGVEGALRDAGHAPTVLELDRDLPKRLAAATYDVVFPAVHGRIGEDGSLQGLLEVLQIPYVGSGVLASALAMSKPHAKAHFRQIGLPVAGDAVVTAGTDLAEAVKRVRQKLGTAVVVKPGAGGSALGVELIPANADESVLARALSRALEFDTTVLVEQMVVGKEVTCGVLESDGEGDAARALPPTLIVPQAAEFYDFKAKYAPSGSKHQCPAPFATELVGRIQAAAVAAHTVLGCRDLSRTDFVVDEASGKFTVLEVNTLPGMTKVSLYPEEASAAGISFAELCDRLVRRAYARPRSKDIAAPNMPM